MIGGGSLLRPGTPEPRYTVTLGGREFAFARARLGAYLVLAYLEESIEAAAKIGANGDLADHLLHYLEAGAGVDRATFEGAPWIDVALAYWKVQAANRLAEADKLAIIKHASKGRPVRWDYAERPLVVWVDMMARAYGWTADQTLDLFPEEAIAFAQEIEAHDYYEHRFIHALSQVAYRVEGGKATYRPLDQPFWMAMAGEKKRVRLDRRTLPQGMVLFPRGTPEDLRH